ncbi:MAG TPA: hypothetical protein VFZ65_08800 [Planctomycetota bacterium]|nr:hypothetical protein [Planctomycetota bacterium]
MRSARDRLWIVVGYSGDSDPLWDTLRHLLVGGDPAPMWWVNLSRPRGAPARDLARAGGKVLVKDADAFFTALANALPPRAKGIVMRPGPRDRWRGARWLFHPVGTVRATANRLATGEGDAGVQEQLETANAVVRKAWTLLLGRRPRPEIAWRRLVALLEQFDPIVANEQLRLVVKKRRSMNVRADEKRQFARLVEDRRLRGSQQATAVRQQALCACAHALMVALARRPEVPKDVTRVSRWLEDLPGVLERPELQLALAAVALSVAGASFEGSRKEKPGLLEKGRRALARAMQLAVACDARRAARRHLKSAALATTPAAKRQHLTAALQAGRLAVDWRPAATRTARTT